MKNLKHNTTSVVNINYHIIWCPKYRRSVLVGGVETRLKELLPELAEESGCTIDTMEVMPDHIHLLVDCKPQICLSDAIKVLKGNTARWLFLAHPEIKKQLWGGHLWNPSYFVSTVSERTIDQVERYIKEQKTE